MLAVKTDLSCAVYSVGKTGSTSLLSALTADWHGVGEHPADFMFELTNYTNSQTGHLDQYNAALYLAERVNTLYCVIRDPWKRYISGLKEVLADSLSALGDDDNFGRLWDNLMQNPKLLTAHLDRLYYLTEYRISTVLPTQFSLHQNYHMRNWLHEVEHLKINHSATVILNSELDSLITDIGLTPVSWQNLSQPDQLRAIESAFVNTSIYNTNNIIHYLNGEIEVYNRLMSNCSVKKLELV